MRELSVYDVARYFLARQDPSAPITNKKLQKLVYLAQGTTLAMLHRSLWDTSKLGDRVTAYKWGPVVPDLWRHYNKARWRELSVPTDVDFDSYDSASRAVMDAVLAKYGHLTADELANLTHHHDPWVETWAKASKEGPKPVGYDVIPEPDLAEYFTQLLAGPNDPRSLTPEQLAAVMRANPEWVEEDARAAAEVAAGQGMGLGELRRFLNL
jgi:uncharacterized phage-associated protein